MNTFLSKLTIVLFLISFLNLPAQVKTKELKAKDIPTDIKYEGTLKKAIQWEDKAGYHIVILAETGIYINKDLPHESEGRDAELYAYHFLDAEDLIVQVWKVFDYIHDCELDIEASFIENTLAVTDLNKDESPEIWIMYKKVCHGDVSPSEMKIIMYENAKKYAMRGENKIQYGDDDAIGGEYILDKSFEKGPSVFRAFAIELWNKNILQKWD
jgi:hypothetical protein